MEKELFYRRYWSMYRNLEEKVISIQKYIEFSEDNFSTYSDELLILLTIICSEVNTIYKLIDNKSNNIIDFKRFVMNEKNNFKDIVNEEVHLIKYNNIIFKPFEAWKTDGYVLGWWNAYNKGKHERNELLNYEKANLENVLNALAGLFLLEIYYYNRRYYDPSSKETIKYIIPKGRSKLFDASILKSNFVRVSDMEGILIED